MRDFYGYFVFYAEKFIIAYASKNKSEKFKQNKVSIQKISKIIFPKL